MKKEDFKHGMSVTGILQGEAVLDAKICINSDGAVFICQNTRSGNNGAFEKFGYKYSYLLYDANGEDWWILEGTELSGVEKGVELSGGVLVPERVNNPKHYNLYPVEAIDLMIGMFGKERVKDFCLLNAMKYRLRLGLKDDFSQDLAKEKWYLDKYNSL